MMKKLFCILFFCVSIYTQAQIKILQDMDYDSISYDVFIVKVTQENLKNFKILHNTESKKHREFVESKGVNNSFFINAFIVDSGCSPVGYCVSEGKVEKPVNLKKKGNGNFYQLKSGALLLTKERALICRSTEIDKSKNVYMGLQSSPLLVMNDSINSEFDKGSSRKNKRCGVGVFTKKGEDFLVFCKSNDAVNFYQFAALFKNKYKCRKALCLESGVCVMNVPDTLPKDEDAQLTICNYIYYHE